MCGAVKNSLLQGPYCFPVIFPFILITLGMVLRHLMGTSSIDSGLTDYFFGFSSLIALFHRFCPPMSKRSKFFSQLKIRFFSTYHGIDGKWHSQSDCSIYNGTRVDLYQNWLEWFLSTLSFSLLIQMFRKTSDSLTTVGFTHSTPTQLKRTTSWASNAAKNYWYWRGEMRPRRNGGGPGTTARRLGTYREIYLG